MVQTSAPLDALVANIPRVTLGVATLIIAAACGRPAPRQTSSRIAPWPDSAPHSSGSGGATSYRPDRGAPRQVRAPDTPPSCGAPDCRLYANVEASLAPLLDTDVQVIAFGEAHALQGTETIPSTARRFTDGVLPLFAGRSSDLVLELMIPNPECRQAEAEVVRKQAEVTQPQAPSNQSEYVALAQRAKDLGIRPHVLRPSCEQYDRILGAGENDIGVMLEMIAELTAQKVNALLGLAAMHGSKALILTYGGLLHNDVIAREGREGWTFGPALRDSTRGRYIAVDLIVREYVRSSSVWQALPWFAHFDGAKYPSQAVAFTPTRGELTVIYPWTAADDSGTPATGVASPASATPPASFDGAAPTKANAPRSKAAEGAR